MTTQEDDQPRYRHRLVRDLAWVLQSSPLFSTEAISNTAVPTELNPAAFSLETFSHYVKEDYLPGNIHAWLKALDLDPGALAEHIEPRAWSRVGVYFEQLLGFFFAHHPDYELIAKNLQVQGEQQTLGEFDFIVYHRPSKRFFHIETAVKFYLGFTKKPATVNNNPVLFGWQHWIGPNGKDTLSIKLDKMYHRQLTLHQHHRAQNLLGQLGLTESQLESRLLLRGRFFKAPGLDTLPFGASPNRDEYRWHRLDDFPGIYEQQTTALFYILPRSYWLSSPLTDDTDEIPLKAYQYPELLRELQAQAAQGVGNWQISSIAHHEPQHESARFFIIG